MGRPALGPEGATSPLREFVIALTGEVRGEIEACGCPTVPYGGFGRRAVYLDRLRAEGPPVFVLDAGEMLVRGRSSAKSPDRVARATAVLDLARGVGLDAWAPAPLDLVAGGLGALSNTNALSATWRDGAGAALLPAATVIERGGLRLGVVGVSAPAAELGHTDAAHAVAEAMEGLVADAWVVLTNDPASTEALAQIPGIGAVLSTRAGELDAPRITTGAPIVETPERGRYVTALRVVLASDGAGWEVVSDGPQADVAEERQRLAQIERAAAEGPGGPRVDRARLTTLLAERDRVAARHDLVLVDTRPMGSDLDAPSPVDARIHLFKVLAADAAENRTSQAPKVAGYRGSGSCTNCHDHSERYAAWAFDPHARAYEPLIPRGKELDVECVGCHTTAWGEPGGNAALTMAAMQTWKAVQCEACHGPAAGHPGAGVKPTIPTVDTCVACHDAANSPQFDYAAYLARLSCTSVSKRHKTP